MIYRLVTKSLIARLTHKTDSMNRVVTVLLSLIIMPLALRSQVKSAYDEVKALIKQKDYFAARHTFEIKGAEMSIPEKLLAKAALDAAFNRPAASNSAIAAYQKNYTAMATDSLRLELLRLKQLNHARMFEYREALQTVTEMLEKYGTKLPADDSDDYKNMLIIWNALKDSPAQKIVKKGDTSLKMKRDKAGLANLDVTSGAAWNQFIFDTGANFSTVTESTAKAFGMNMLEGTIEVGSITGAKVNARLAICPEFVIGNVFVKNAVFLVFPDGALAFPQLQYQINGIIGFPVIEGMKQVQITRDDRFIIPDRPLPGSERNMALEFLTPLYRIGSDYYTFDTGANSTILYARYYEAHKAEIEDKYPVADLQYGGAGGVVAKKGYKIDFHPAINGKMLELKNVQLFAEEQQGDKKYYFGNIGQDVIRQFSQLTLNFADMYIRFE